MRYTCICCCVVEGESGPKIPTPSLSSPDPLETNAGSMGGLELTGSEHDHSANTCTEGNIVILL